jgi:hypothetical protein
LSYKSSDGAEVSGIDSPCLIDEKTGERIPALIARYVPGGESELIISKDFMEAADKMGASIIEDVNLSAPIAGEELVPVALGENEEPVPVEHYYLDFKSGELKVVHIPTGKIFSYKFTTTIAD